MDVEVIGTPLPELRACRPFQLARSLLLEDLEGDGERREARFAEEQMDMLGHEHIYGNGHAAPFPHSLKFAPENAVGATGGQQRSPSLTTESDKVRDAALLVTDQAFGHDGGILNGVRSRGPCSPTRERQGAGN